VRAFVAFTLPAVTRAALARACEALRETAPEWAGEKWVPEENLHVTLSFIGGLGEEAVPGVLDCLTAACAPLRPFDLTLGDIVTRPGGKHPRMLWARFAEGIEPARHVAEAVQAALLEAVALEPEKRQYTPHVTLARFRVPRRVPEPALDAANAVIDAVAPACGGPADVSPAIVSVPRVTLMSSRLSRYGPTYEEVASVPLGSD
jgi:RNA 2',3'-cyclic 3'-phosphodiesterase